MKEVYIMLSQLGTMVSKSIKLYTKAKYNHASLGIDPEMQNFYSFARRVRYFPVIAGFISEKLNEGMFGYYPNTECVIYALSVSDAQYNKVRDILEGYLKEGEQYKYNFLALLGITINRPFAFEKRHTCAEFVAKVLSEAGIYNFPKPFSLVRPDELPGIPGLRVIYEGRMTGFRPIMGT